MGRAVGSSGHVSGGRGPGLGLAGAQGCSSEGAFTPLEENEIKPQPRGPTSARNSPPGPRAAAQRPLQRTRCSGLRPELSTRGFVFLPTWLWNIRGTSQTHPLVYVALPSAAQPKVVSPAGVGTSGVTCSSVTPAEAPGPDTAEEPPCPSGCRTKPNHFLWGISSL